MSQLRRLILLLVSILLVAAPVCEAVPFTASLDGPSENPPVPSPGTGTALIDFDLTTHTLSVQASFEDLVGPTTVAHIHCCVAPPGNAGVATTTPSFPNWPTGVMSGSYSMVFDTTLASTYNPAFVADNGGSVTAAEAALFAGIAAGMAYFNIHTEFRPGGEIRGFLQPAQVSVSAPATLVLLVLGLGAFQVAVRGRQQGAVGSSSRANV
jgi:CHRD domain